MSDGPLLRAQQDGKWVKVAIEDSATPPEGTVELRSCTGSARPWQFMQSCLSGIITSVPLVSLVLHMKTDYCCAHHVHAAWRREDAHRTEAAVSRDFCALDRPEMLKDLLLPTACRSYLLDFAWIEESLKKIIEEGGEVTLDDLESGSFLCAGMTTSATSKNSSSLPPPGRSRRRSQGRRHWMRSVGKDAKWSLRVRTKRRTCTSVQLQLACCQSTEQECSVME